MGTKRRLSTCPKLLVQKEKKTKKNENKIHVAKIYVLVSVDRKAKVLIKQQQQ